MLLQGQNGGIHCRCEPPCCVQWPFVCPHPCVDELPADGVLNALQTLYDDQACGAFTRDYVTAQALVVVSSLVVVIVNALLKVLLKGAVFAASFPRA